MADAASLARELTDVALAAATAAAELVHDRRPAVLQVDHKSTATDHVTEMDRAAEELIRSLIGDARPHDVVVGEEYGGDEAPAGVVTWWVDPIDGTTNYVYDHPGYAVSVAAALDGVTLAGVVADPTHGRTYVATAGAGATCRSARGEVALRLGPPSPLDRALVATGFGYDAATRARQGEVVAGLLPLVRDVRRMGAAALDLCSVGAGRVDAYYEAGLSMWDLAAGALVATEAGARVGSLDGGPVRPGSVLAAHPALYDELCEVLARLGGDGR